MSKKIKLSEPQKKVLKDVLKIIHEHSSYDARSDEYGPEWSDLISAIRRKYDLES